MSRITKFILFGTILFICAASAQAQQTVRGQLYLPSGDTPNNSIRFLLTRSDGMINDYRFTDTTGRFILERLASQFEYTITIESDERTYGRTVYSFIPSYLAVVRIHLEPLPVKPVAKTETPPANAPYRPAPAAVKANEEAMKSIQEDRFDEAEKLFREAIAEDPKFPEPLLGLGGLLIQQRKLAEAEKVIRQGLALDSKSAYGQMALGMVLVRTERYADAIAPLRESIRLNKSMASPHLYLGVALVETEKFDEAEQELNEADNVTGIELTLRYLYLGQLYARTGRYEKSIPAFESYLQRSPDAKNAADVRALIERMKQQIAKKD